MTPPPLILAFLAALVLLYHVSEGLYFARGLEPSPALDLLYRAGLVWSTCWWLAADSRRHKVTPVYCLGLLVTVAWVIIIPHHLLKTRGLKGVVTILCLLGVFAAAQIVAVMVYLIFSAAG